MSLKTIFTIVIVSILSWSNCYSQQHLSSIKIGERYNLYSKVLKENRVFNIYLPPNYGVNKLIQYPVIYLMDGDYNFHHTTGLIEQLSSISEKVPEMIIVGIVDNGHEMYTKNCTPYNKKNNPNGQSEKFLQFINKELKPLINHTYNTSKFDLLIGHSLGGLFVINTLLTQPNSFESYIAISPSLWWNDYNAENEVEKFNKKHDLIDKSLFLSLANEKGMGVHGFYDQLDIQSFADDYYQNKPLGLNYHFMNFPNENHNSVGLVTVDAALKQLYSNYILSASKIKELNSFNDYIGHIESLSKKIGKGFHIPNRILKQMIRHFYENHHEELLQMKKIIALEFPSSLGDFNNNLGNLRIKKGNKIEGLKLLTMNCETNPNSVEYIVSLADAVKEDNPSKATEYYSKALILAKKQGARQWYINQLISNTK